jgi:hypothetical protein
VRAVRPDELGRMARHGLRVAGKTAALALDDGVARVRVEVHDRREVPVDAQARERARGGCRVTAGCFGLIQLAQLLVGNALRKAINGLEPVHAAALLVNRHQQRRAGCGLQAGDEFLHLGRRLDVPPTCGAVRHLLIEEDDTAEMVFADVAEDERTFVGPAAAEADEKQLAKLLAQRQGWGSHGVWLGHGPGNKARTGRIENPFPSRCSRRGQWPSREALAAHQEASVTSGPSRASSPQTSWPNAPTTGCFRPDDQKDKQDTT